MNGNEEEKEMLTDDELHYYQNKLRRIERRKYWVYLGRVVLAIALMALCLSIVVFVGILVLNQ